jgi:hypothetical protein
MAVGEGKRKRERERERERETKKKFENIFSDKSFSSPFFPFSQLAPKLSSD